jgi:hypothetical protein
LWEAHVADDDLLGTYSLHRAFQRSQIADWIEDLAGMGNLLASLATEIEYETARSGRANNARAAEVLPPARIRKADSRLHGLRGDQEAFKARLCACGPLARDTYSRTTDSRFSIAALDIIGLENLGGFFRRLAARMRGWDRRFSGGPRAAGRDGQSGRLPDIAAAELVAACRKSGRPLRAVAQAAIDLGIERPRRRAGDDDAALLAERWRKVAARQRTK